MHNAYVVLPVLAAIAVVVYVLGGPPEVPYLVLFGFVLGAVDTAFGMGYGTLATPVLLVAGFSPISIVPAVLLSQMVAAVIGTALHVRYKHVDLADIKGNDAKLSAAIIAFGVAGVVAAVLLAVRLPPFYVKVYIGTLVVAMGLLLLAKPRLQFSWPKVFVVSAVNGFDKAISGGGSGPMAVGGLLTLGQTIKNSVGIAVFTVTVINFAGVTLYLALNSFGLGELFLMAALSVGALLGSLVGPGITRQLHTNRHINAIALVIVVVGVLSLLSTFASL